MKIVNTFLLLFITLASWTQEANVSFMTYNIRLDVASDGENAWPHRKEFLLNQIKFYEPSILGTQEALPHQLEYLDNQLEDYAVIGEGRDGNGKGEFSSIFYHKKKFKVLKSDTFWLSLTPEVPSKNWDAALNRICTYGLFMEIKTGEKFWVFNTHFDHIGVQSRLNAIDIIQGKIKKLNTTNLPVIFMGDLNVEPNNAVISKVKKFMNDAFEVSMNPTFGSYGTYTDLNSIGEKREELIISLFQNRIKSK